MSAPKSSTAALAKAIERYESPIDRIEVARYYLKSELGRLIPSQAAQVVNAIDKSIDDLDDQATWQLLEALSWSFRLNWMFFLIGDEGLDWHDIELPVSELQITGMGPEIDRLLLNLPEVDWNARRAAAYLNEYFAANPRPDGTNLDDFRKRRGVMRHKSVTAHCVGNSIHTADGSHRIIRQIMDGATSVRVFLALPNGKKRMQRMGSGLAYQLLRMYRDKFRRPEQRELLLDVTEMIARNSSDGRENIETFWIEHQESKPKMQAVGIEMLERVKRR